MSEPDFASYRREPNPSVKEPTAVMTFRMPSSFRRRLRVAAAAEGISMNSYVLALIDAAMPAEQPTTESQVK